MCYGIKVGLEPRCVLIVCADPNFLSPSIALLYRTDRAVLVQPFKTGGLDIDATLLKYSYHADERELASRYAQRRKDYATHEELIPLYAHVPLPLSAPHSRPCPTL